MTVGTLHYTTSPHHKPPSPPQPHTRSPPPNSLPATLLIALLGTLILYSTTLWISTRSNLSTDPHGNTILSSLTNDTFTTPAFVLLTILPITYGFLKATFFILYLQLFYQLRWMRVGASVGLAVNAVTYVGFTVATLYLFVRRDIVVYGGVAIPLAAWGVVSDVVVLLMPIVAVVRLRVERRKKVGAVCIFLSGLMYVPPLSVLPDGNS